MGTQIQNFPLKFELLLYHLAQGLRAHQKILPVTLRKSQENENQSTLLGSSSYALPQIADGNCNRLSQVSEHLFS